MVIKERKVWRGRTPFWRLYVTKVELQILEEVLSDFMARKGLYADPHYSGILNKVKNTAVKIETPLVANVADTPLFDNDWDMED